MSAGQSTLERPRPAAESRPAAERGGATRTPPRARIGTSRRLANLAMFSRQLFVLESCGTPIVQALGALRRQATDETWETVLEYMQETVEGGESLSAAMADFPQCFDSVCQTLVAAGEAAGNLSEMLERLAALTQQRLAMRRSVLGALTYPALLLSVATGAFLILMFMVIPRFAGMFETLNAPLPTMTKMIFGFSALLRTYWWGALIVLAAGAGGVALAVRSEAGQMAIDTMLVRVPKLGYIVRQFCTGRITRLLGVLIEAKVPLLEALELTSGAVGNRHYRRLLADAGDVVGRGDALSDAFNAPHLISPSVYEAVRSGEQAGQVGPLLLAMADFIDEDNDTTVRSLTTILEPLILIVLGLLIGFVAISMFMPLFDLTAVTKGGG